MKGRKILAVCGGLALVLAAIGSITSISAVRAGSLDGGVYMAVNIALALVGVVLLFVGLFIPARAARTAAPSAGTRARREAR